MKVIKLYSEHCGPCKVVEKKLQEANIEHESVDITDIEAVNYIENYKVSSVPTLLIVNEEGDLIKKFTGIPDVNEIIKYI